MNTPAQAADHRALLQNSLRALEAMEAKLAAAERAKTEPIAVLGMSCRFPGGVDSPESFWQLLHEGRDAIATVPADRRALAAAFGLPIGDGPGQLAWAGGFLDRIDLFDPDPFGITPREARTMDPQQRLVLETAWEALERAGHAPDRLAGSRTGVFVGVSTNEYGRVVNSQSPDKLDAYVATGNAVNVVAGRVSFALGLQGPAVAVDTACSSSLVAVHLAVQSLRNGESDMALAGGVNVVLMPHGFLLFTTWGMMAGDGRCKTFDARADGFVRSEGCGMLLLKRLSDALADGDPILAVIRGSAVNQDGRSSGLTVPNGRAQQAMLRAALANAGLAPAQVQFIEAHGTGTAIGDPIEVEALGAVLGQGRRADQPLFLSSVKTNIGHPESAAGVASLIKVILSMQHGEIPPLLHLQERSPKIPWPAFPIELPTVPTPWPGEEGVRIAGVSGFGFSGTNAHVLLASPPPASKPAAPPAAERAQAEGRRHLLTLSARSAAAVREAAARLAAHLAEQPGLDPADVCFTANTGRAQFAHRLALVAGSADELRARLRSLAQEEGSVPSGGAAGSAAGRPPRVAFLFTGQGAQYAGMGRSLYEHEPVFRAALDRCADLLRPHLEHDLRDVLYGSGPQTTLLDQTGYTQPALFALEYALAAQWQAWGVAPGAVVGHSVGEYVAAVVAGVLGLEEGLRLIAARGRLMQSLPAGGAMAALFAPLEQVQAAVEPYAGRLAVAAANGPEHTVISGDADAVESVMEQFGARGVRVQRLTVSHAFHSPRMEPILDEFERVAAGIAFRPPRIPLVSNLTGAVAGDEITTPGYWRRHLREAVRFGAGIEALNALGVDILLEVGPHPTLLGMAQQIPQEPAPAALPSLRRKRDDHQQMLESLAQLYVRGAPVELAALDAGAPRARLTLPTYPFQRSRYWVDLPAHGAQDGPGNAGYGYVHPLLGRRSRSPLLRETLFESEVTATAPAFLVDHHVHGATVFPATAYLEVALAAAADSGALPVQVTNLNLRESLLLDEHPYTLQTVLTPEADGTHGLQLVGFRPDAMEAVHTHASGTVQAAVDAVPARADLAALQAGCPTPVDTGDFYASWAAKGLEYGPAFRGIATLWRGDDRAIGLVRLPEEAGSGAGYRLHPALLDACFQVIGAFVPDVDAGVPVGITGLTLFKAAPAAVWCYAERLPTGLSDNQALACRLLLLDEAGETVAALERLEMLPAARGVWERRGGVASWLYQIGWRPQPLDASAAPAEAGRWLLLGDGGGSTEALARLLADRNGTVTLVTPGDETAEHAPGRWQVRPNDPAAFDAILDAVGPLRGAVCLWSDSGAALHTPQALADRQEQVCATTLHLAQALGRRDGDPPRLWIATRGAQAADGVEAPVAPADAPLWGLGRVIALENPSLRCTLVDLDPADDGLGPLADDLLAADEENQIALRSGVRLAARFAAATVPAPFVPNAPGTPYRLALPERGLLDRLTYAPLEAREPGPGEVAVTVHATGLNFRDVLNVLGMYPGDPGPPGIECAGVVSAVGAGVTRFAVGDAVAGLAPRSFDAVVVTPADQMAHKPAALSFAEAATVPSTFLTADHGLRGLAGLQRGGRVLIHAAAGGVGMAAVQIARRIGAEVFATAGSAAKHAFLRSLGVEHIFSSRTANFRERLLELTGGQGVDVVLNSLSDDFISDSFAVLAPGGCFLEIGKRGIWTHEQAAAARPDVRYLPYDLGDVLRDEPERIRIMLEEILAAMADGDLAPLPLRAFGAESVVEAFRFMAQARHIGKVVITHRPAAWEGLVRADGAYLVTGGLGGLGLRVAGWLAEQGAGALVLLGRRSPSPAAAEAIDAMRARGTEVQVLAADISRREDVARALEAVARTGRPLRGLFHAAGVLDDGTLAQQRWERFVTVFAPKVDGTMNLHQATHGAPLDHFVLFSSGAALLGSPGQANYAAANAFLDALAHHRRALGLPALSVNWGAWSEVGMAAALAESAQRRTAQRGMGSIAPAQGLAALEMLLARGTAQAAVLPIDWRVLREQFPDGEPPRFLAEAAAAAAPARPKRAAPAAGDAVPFHTTLAAAPRDQRCTVLVERLVWHVAEVTGIERALVEPGRSLSEFGLDSLMAVELKNRIDRDLRGSLALTALLAGPAIEELASELLAGFDGPAPSGGAEPAAAAPEEMAATNGHPLSPEEALANLDQMSNDDVDAMLAALLEDQEKSA